jgi:hypothetical protein
MPAAATRSDAVRVIAAGVEDRSLHVVGTIPGVAPLAAAGRCGPGVGRIRSVGDGTRLQWRAPGVDVWGDLVSVAADGDYLLESGDDIHAWLRVRVIAASLGPPFESQVRLSEWYNNALAAANFSAAEVAAGTPRTYAVTLKNESDADILDLVAQVDTDAERLSIMDDEFGFPGSEVQFGNLAAGAEVQLWCVRSIAGAGADPDLLAAVNLFWFGA